MCAYYSYAYNVRRCEYILLQPLEKAEDLVARQPSDLRLISLGKCVYLWTLSEPIYKENSAFVQMQCSKLDSNTAV